MYPVKFEGRLHGSKVKVMWKTICVILTGNVHVCDASVVKVYLEDIYRNSI